VSADEVKASAIIGDYQHETGRLHFKRDAHFSGGGVFDGIVKRSLRARNTL
jgi:hypothetical protein